MRQQWRLLLATLVFLISMTVAHQVQELFAPVVLWCLFLMGVVCCTCFFFKKIKKLSLLFSLIGLICLIIAYTQARAWQRLNEQVQPQWVGQVVSIQGIIDSHPTRTPYGVRFIFKPTPEQSNTEIKNSFKNKTLPMQISTAWYDDDLPVSGADVLRVGQVWQLPLGLKRTHATQNQGVFDQEQDWFARDVRGLATVKLNKETPMDMRPQHIRTEHSFWSVTQNMRAAALQRIDVVLTGRDEEATALFKALTFGEQSAISNNQWALFQQTGITHLVSISGLHITMLAMLMAWLVQRLWRRSVVLCEWMPSLHAAQWVGLLVAFIYALLAGWGLPAQRTVLMLAVWLFLSRLGVASSGVRVVCFALWIVLLYDPFAVLSISFWLSFGAVAWLILALGAEKGSDDKSVLTLPFYVQWLHKGGAQLAIGVALLPVTLYFFHQASILGVLVNFVAIPLVSIIVTPLLLLACFVNFAFNWAWPLLWAHQMLWQGLRGLNWLVEIFPQGLWVHTLSWWQVVTVTVVGVVVVICLRHRLWLRSALALCVVIIVLLIPRSITPIDDGEMRVHVIDIGQGSAILLQTSHQTWLYDAGPKYGVDSDAGGRVIVPYLRELGIERVDAMVLSHNDADHTGGAASVSRSVKVGQVFSSMSNERINEMGVISAQVHTCIVGQQWSFDGITLNMLSPNQMTLNDTHMTDNQKSCVLRMDTNKGEFRSLLLTGDIDALQEARLVVSPFGGVRDWHSDVVMMPHHGSGASSSAPFIEATSPKVAIAQAGYLNPFHHPHPLALARYQDAGAHVLETVKTGAVQLCIGCEQSDMVFWRDAGRRYWWE